MKVRSLACRIALAGAFCFSAAHSQSAEPETVLLWPGGAPGALGDADIDKPSLTIFPARAGNIVPTAVIVCPGGGYMHLAMTYEGFDIAKWLNQRGVTAFVLKYRLGPKYRHPVELQDAQRAIRYARAHAQEYGYRSDRIGIWGFSAGGHLAATAGTHFDAGNSAAADPLDRPSSRPDFMVLAYPVITFAEPYAHKGSRTALLGDNPSRELIDLLSNEKQVTRDTPPAFLFQTTEDKVVPAQNSILFYSALIQAGIPAELHVYLKGKHGVGLAPTDPVLKSWPDRLADWLRVEGFL